MRTQWPGLTDSLCCVHRHYLWIVTAGFALGEKLLLFAMPACLHEWHRFKGKVTLVGWLITPHVFEDDRISLGSLSS